MSQDILRYILSEFLYFDDVFNCLLSNSHFNVNPHQLNFETDKNITLNSLNRIDQNHIETYYFDKFSLKSGHKHFNVTKKLKINKFRTSQCFNEPLESYFENMEQNQIESMRLGWDYTCPLPEKLPKTLKTLFLGNCLNLPIPTNIPQLNSTTYEHRLPENLPVDRKNIK